jgi:hypothetical protein
MARVLLIHWKEEEAAPRVEEMRGWGHDVAWRGMRENKEVKVTSARKHAAEVVVFDLSRMPVYSKYHAELIRKAKSTAHIPFVFVGGEREKVEVLRALYPGEIFTQWSRLRKVLEALPKGNGGARKGPVAGVEAVRQLWQKVGLKEGMKVYAESAPREFFAALGDAPESVEFQEHARGAALSLFFFESWDRFGESADRVVTQARLAPVWVFYRKGALKSTELREALLDFGLVDYKICSVNSNWAGILVRQKKA